MCVERRLSRHINLNRLLHITELGWSFILPACITFVLDIRVMLTRPPGLFDELHKQTRRQRGNEESFDQTKRMRHLSWLDHRSVSATNSYKKDERPKKISQIGNR